MLILFRFAELITFTIIKRIYICAVPDMVGSVHTFVSGNDMENVSKAVVVNS
jgi:hypothetical protein